MSDPPVRATRRPIEVAWFWTFWHWSTERFRDGALLRSPMQGIGSHWDEWFRHEASTADRQQIDAIGASRDGQRAFIRWLVRVWSTEAQWRGVHPLARHVLAQLAHLPPFDEWASFARYRDSFGVAGVSAIVLTGSGRGDPEDVRPVEALLLPLDPNEDAPLVVPEGFDADPADLMASRRAAATALEGEGLRRLLMRWLVRGRRPYPPWLALLLDAGWFAVVALVLFLLLAPDPQDRLPAIEGVLLALWLSLLVVAVLVDGIIVAGAWRTGRRWRRVLEGSQLRLRMRGGLRVHGASAGLPVALSTLLAVHRSAARQSSRAWLWSKCLAPVRAHPDAWAATGSVAVNGAVSPVVLTPKLVAALHHARITDVLVPWQPEGRQRAIDRLGEESLPAVSATRREIKSGMPVLGFAADKSRLRGHRARHVADAILALGNMTRRGQLATTVVAWSISLVMCLALPDIRSALWPPAAPVVIGPASPSPYYLWVSVATEHPEQFAVVFESAFWSNRRADIASYDGANASVRAEMLFTRRARVALAGEEDGIVYIERRRRFLSREFAHGERVGRYTLSYLSRIGHE